MMENNGFSDCEICKGIGWLREELEVFDNGFGELVPCECNLEALAKIEEEPQREPDLSWTEWTD